MTDHVTEQSLAEQFTENTGRSLFDSGDAYGRGWQRKAGMKVSDFRDRPRAYAEYDYLSIDAFHWLADRLTYMPELDATFEKWANQPKRASDAWLVSAEECAELIRSLDPGASSDGITVVNTYNHDSMLNETLQFVAVRTYQYDWLVFLQTHNGCDVRGGYSRPRVYQISDMEGIYSLLDERVEVYCPGFEESDAQAEVLDGMPEREESWHAFDFRGGEWVDHDGACWSGNEDDFPIKIDEGVVTCTTHSRTCEVSLPNY